MIYDVIIIGAGPAGSAAAVYAARKKLKTLLLAEFFGGQSIVSDDIQNWVGEKSISGFDLAKKLENHVRSFENQGAEIKIPEKAVKISTTECANGSRQCDFEIETDQGGKYRTKTVILASGARRRRLGIPGEDKLEGKGVAFCSTCDAPLFSGKTVAVVGGGNAGFEAAIDLIPYADKIYILERGDSLKADPVTQEEAGKNSKIEIILNAITKEILGDKFVSGLKYIDAKNNQEKTLVVGGVFVEVGSTANSEMVKGLVDLDKWGQVIIDSKRAASSFPGIFAAGDVTDDPYKQNNISAGDGVKAALSAYGYLLGREKK